MNGFIYQQYETKWRMFVRRVFLVRLFLLFAYVLLISLTASPSILWGVFTMVDPLELDATIGRGGGPVFGVAMHPAVVKTAMSLAIFITVLEAWELYLSVRRDEDEEEEVIQYKLKLKQAAYKIHERGGLLLLFSTVSSIISCIALISEDQYSARAHGWVRFFLALGSSTAWVVLLAQGALLSQKLRVFVNVVGSALYEDVMLFVVVFTPLLIGFTTGMNSLLQLHPVWETRWGSWWLTLENLLLLSFIQEPPIIAGDDSPSPSSIVALFGEFGVAGSDAVLPTVLFYVFFVLYLVVSVVLLINLLIAMMSARYDRKRQNADLDTRVAFCRLVLRVERLIELSVRQLGLLTRDKSEPVSRTALGNKDSSQRDITRSSEASRSNRSDRARGSGGATTAPPPDENERARALSASANVSETRCITFRQLSSKSSKRFKDDGIAGNIFDADKDDEAASVSEQLKQMTGLLERLEASQGSAAGTSSWAEGERAGEPLGSGERWRKAAAEAANRAAAEMLRARNAHEVQTKAFRSIVQQLLAGETLTQSTPLGKSSEPAKSLSAQLEVADAAAAKAQSAMLTAGEGIIEAAQAARASHNGKNRPAEPSTIAIERLRRLTQNHPAKAAPDEQTAFEARVRDAVSKRTAVAAKRGFVSFVDWPPEHPPFASHAPHVSVVPAYPGPPQPDAMIRCLPTSELRSFLCDLFEDDEQSRDDMAKMPGDLVGDLAQAFDPDGDGLIKEHELYGRWNLIFGARGAQRVQQPASNSFKRARAPEAYGRAASRSLPANIKSAMGDRIENEQYERMVFSANV